MDPTEGQLITEQRACNKCKTPCFLGDFKQVAGLRNSDLLIYIHKDTDTVEQKVQQKKKKIIFILHNNSDKELKRPDYIKEMCQYRTKCIQCREFIHRVRSLLDEITDIKQNDVIGVCEYCKRLNPSGNCKRCEHYVNEFKSSQATQKQEMHERFLSWLHKVNALIQSILECKNVCTSRLYNEPSQYLNDLLKLLQELKPPIDVPRPDMNLLSKMMKSANDANIIEMLEELLLKMKYDTGISNLPKMSKSAYDANTMEPMKEYSRLTIMETLAKNKEKLEELLLKMKCDTDIRLLSKMLNYASGAKDKMEFGRSSSMESLAKHKKMLEELLLNMKYDRMMEHSSDNIIDKNLNSNDISPDQQMKIAQAKPAGQENALKKIIRVMSQKGTKKHELTPDVTMIKDKTTVTIHKKKKIKKKQSEKQASGKLKPELSKRERHDKRRDSFDIDSLDNISDDLKDNKERRLRRKRDKKHEAFDIDSLENVSDDIKDKKERRLRGKRDKKQDSQDSDSVQSVAEKRKKHKQRGRTHDSVNNEEKEKLSAKKNKLHSDSFDVLMPFVKVQKAPRKLIKGTQLVNLKDTQTKKQPAVAPHLYKQIEIKDFDQSDLPAIYNRSTQLVTLKDDQTKKQPEVAPHLYKQIEIKDLVQSDLPAIYNPSTLVIIDEDLKAKRSRQIRSPVHLLSYDETRQPSGVLYQLSNREFIRKGWTIMPKTKSLRKVCIYKMEPALPQYDWFGNNKKKEIMFYDSGEKLAEINDSGYGRWFYKNGEVALDFYNTEDSHAGQRYVLYSRGDDLDVGKTTPRTVLASFDYCGNGVVYDRYGNERLKYNQFEGKLNDEKVGPMSRWKWHSLNEPPELYEINVENYVKHIDPGFKEIFEKVNSEDNPRKPRDRASEPEMLAIEHENNIKHHATKQAQKFEPFKIRMKALKINDNFSLRVLDQANIYVLFREGPTKLKLNVGMNLINEVIENEIFDTADVMTPYERLPPLSPSLEDIQNRVDKAKKAAMMRADKTERLIMPPKLSRSAYKVGIGIKEQGPCSVQPQVQYPYFQTIRRD